MNHPCYTEERLTLREISERLGISLNTVRTAAKRGCFETTYATDPHGKRFRVATLTDARSHFGEKK